VIIWWIPKRFLLRLLIPLCTLLTEIVKENQVPKIISCWKNSLFYLIWFLPLPKNPQIPKMLFFKSSFSGQILQALLLYGHKSSPTDLLVTNSTTTNLLQSIHFQIPFVLWALPHPWQGSWCYPIQLVFHCYTLSVSGCQLWSTQRWGAVHMPRVRFALSKK
jgi:hypothetical protein